MPPKPRTKTFTGCWTCRLRRLKCDEATPQCSPCVEKGIKCGGYDACLQWLPPNNDAFTKSSSKGTTQRRRLLPASSVPRLTDEQLEAAIADIDQVRGAESRGPFSVFQIETPAQDGGDLEEPEPSMDVISQPESTEIQVQDGDLDLEGTEPIMEDTEIHVQSPGQADNTSHHTSLTDGSQYTNDSPSASTSTDFGLTIPHNLFFRPTFLTVEVKYLLDHYSKNVLRIFSILDNKNTPWSSFHLPRALQCCGELEVAGQSTAARSALLHATLSVSAYNLRCRSAGQDQEAVAQKWAEVGLKYRVEALRFLKKSAGNPHSASTSSEYKELLAAMLSMVTVDVVSGDTKTCSVHLSGCESLIRARKAYIKTSSKIKALHRIFFYLRVMQDATELTCNAFQPTHSPGEHDQTGPDDLATYLDPYIPIADEEPDSASYELIYGLPQRLLVLVYKTCNLLKKINGSDAVAFSSLPECDQLEDEILDWPIEDVVARYQRARIDMRNWLILQHHIRAFHNALIIFFCRNIRMMNRRHLQQYVKSVIHHLNEIESIKEKEMINAGPLLWPAFVAGEQAMDDSTRDQFVRWFDVIEQHGVASSKLTRAALEDIWQRLPRSHSQFLFNIPNTQLMLT